MVKPIKCRLCDKPMLKVHTLNSGNSVFNEYECSSCRERKTVCAGVDVSA